MSRVKKQADESKPPPLKVILMVEQDDEFGKLCKRTIQRETSHHVLIAKDPAIALNVLEHIQADLFLLSHQPPQLNGLKTYDLLHTLEGMEQIPAILLERAAPVDLSWVARRQLTLIKQPFLLSALIAAIEKLLSEPYEYLLFQDAHAEDVILHRDGQPDQV